METFKSRRWTIKDGDNFVKDYPIGDLGYELAELINGYIDEMEVLTRNLEGFTATKEPLVVNKTRLDNILEVWNCRECPCENYCNKHTVNCQAHCKTVRKMYLVGKLNGYADECNDVADTEEEEEE